VNLQKEYL